MYHFTKTYYKQQTETIKHQDTYSTEYEIITKSDIVNLKVQMQIEKALINDRLRVSKVS